MTQSQGDSGMELEDIGALPANFAGNCSASIAISLKRIADMMEEDRKPRLELAPEGWVGPDEHRRMLRDLCSILLNDDHKRLCARREYECSCGYDDVVFSLANMLALALTRSEP